MKVCKYCGHENGDDAVRCSECGTENTFGYLRVQVSPKDHEAAREFLLAQEKVSMALLPPEHID